MNENEIFIAGGGVIGLATGWLLLRAGKKVTLFERNAAGDGASRVAAGMLAPQTEAGFEEIEFLNLGLESLQRYPEFLEALENDCGKEVPLKKEGALVIALCRDDEEALKRFFDFRIRLGLPVKWLTGAQAREKEPLLSPQTISAVSIPQDDHIDARELVAALKQAFINQGGELHEGRGVDELVVHNKKLTGIKIQHETIACENLLLAAGCWSSQIAGLPDEARPPVRPVKGQIISLRSNAYCRLKHVIRAPKAYLVPKENNRLLVGATSEEMGYDLTQTAGPVMELLKGAVEAVPAVYDCSILAIEVGLRPASRDHLPILGKTEIEGLTIATGHFRHGILLAPVTAMEITKLMVEGKSEILAPFSPLRFSAQAKQPV